jgi:phosphate:Na+ symporter
MLVIGQNLGTTVTAALATIGASVPARRTGLAHILFNVVAGIAAFALVPLFLYLVQGARLLPGAEDPTVALAAFHTAFNLLGVLILLPVAPRFAGFVSRLVPERGAALTRNLDPTVAEIPAVGVEAARRTVLGIAAAEIDIASDVIGGPAARAVTTRLEPVRDALARTREFLRHIRTSPSATGVHESHLAVLHALDHLDRLEEALLEPVSPIGEDVAGSRELRSRVVEILGQLGTWFDEDGPSPATDLGALSQEVAEFRRARRLEILGLAASGDEDPDRALERLEGLRWLDRVVYHVWRAVHHLAARETTGTGGRTEIFSDARRPVPTDGP